VFNARQTAKKVLLAVCAVFIFISFVVLAGCRTGGEKAGKEKPAKSGTGKLSSDVNIDGSSTVYLITEAVAEEFQKENPDVRVTVGIAGTGGGFKRFVVDETDINDASRPIKDEEKQAAKDSGVKYSDFKVAYDGITLVVNPENDWCDNLSIAELKKIWEPDSKVKLWSDINPDWPKEEIVLFGPDTDSGTFDFFTEKIVGEEGASRSDYTASSDDNVLVEGVSGEKYALGYFGYAYYEANKDQLKAIKVDGVAPSAKTISQLTYEPLSRELYIYVNNKSLERPEVASFVKYYLQNCAGLAEQVGYVPFPGSEYDKELKVLEELTK